MLVQEKVGKGHPDKVCDFIAEKVKAFLIGLDNNARTAIEVCAYRVDDSPPYSNIVIFGEYSISINVKGLNKKIEKYIKEELIDHLTQEYYDYLNIKLQIDLAIQSQEINKKSKQGAGDQGIIAHHYDKEIEDLFEKTEVVKGKLDGLNSIGKDWKLLVDTTNKKVIVNFHFPDYLRRQFDPNMQKKLISNIINSEWKDFKSEINYYILGSILSDSGLSGRKIFCDFPFGYVWGGGAVWGKDSSKVDNSALLYLRRFARILANLKNCKHVKVTLVYNIGIALPTACEILIDGKKIDSSFFVHLFSTVNLDEMIRNKKTTEIEKQIESAFLTSQKN